MIVSAEADGKTQATGDWFTASLQTRNDLEGDVVADIRGVTSGCRQLRDRDGKLAAAALDRLPHLRQQPRLSTAKIVDFGPKTRNSA